MTKDSIRQFRQMRYPAPGGQGIMLEEKEGDNTAILTIKSFDPDLLKSHYKQDYYGAIDSVFSVLKRKGTTKLILDLRDNQGGDFEPGRYLLSYLLINPARYLLCGKEARLIQPQTNHFTGRLFVLINGGSFSNTAIVSACLERDQRAFFVGEETGGNKHIISGEPVEVLLPQTQIRCFVSTTSFRVLPGAGDGHGVLPTHYVLPAITDIFMGSDNSKRLALKLISER